MQRLLSLMLIFPVLPLAQSVTHGDCSVGGNIMLGVVTLGSGQANSTTLYLDDRGYTQGNGIWIYLESNNQSGLQRGGSSIIIPNDNEICFDDSPNGPDTLIF